MGTWSSEKTYEVELQFVIVNLRWYGKHKKGGSQHGSKYRQRRCRKSKFRGSPEQKQEGREKNYANETKKEYATRSEENSLVSWKPSRKYALR